MPKTMKAKKMAASLHVLILGLFHLSFARTTYPVPEKRLLGFNDSGPLWGGTGSSCKGFGWSFDGCRAACRGLRGCNSISCVTVVEDIADTYGCLSSSGVDLLDLWALQLSTAFSPPRPHSPPLSLKSHHFVIILQYCVRVCLY